MKSIERNEAELTRQIYEFLNKNKLYFIGSEKDPTVLIAMHLMYEPQSHILTWWDGNYERKKILAEIYSSGVDGVLFFSDVQGKDYRFLPMNMYLFESFVRARLKSERTFKTVEELHSFLEDPEG